MGEWNDYLVEVEGKLKVTSLTACMVDFTDPKTKLV